MYLVVIAWIYVVLMMSVAEATATNGTALGAIVTFLMYGVGPVTLVVYLMGSPFRRKAIKAREAAAMGTAPDLVGASKPDAGAVASGEPDAGGKAAADAVPAVRKEP